MIPNNAFVNECEDSPCCLFNSFQPVFGGKGGISQVHSSTQVANKPPESSDPSSARSFVEKNVPPRTLVASTFNHVSNLASKRYAELYPTANE